MNIGKMMKNLQQMQAKLQEQMDTLEFFPNYVDTYTVPLVELARKLAQVMPVIGKISCLF